MRADDAVLASSVLTRNVPAASPVGTTTLVMVVPRTVSRSRPRSSSSRNQPAQLPQVLGHCNFRIFFGLILERDEATVISLL